LFSGLSLPWSLLGSLVLVFTSSILSIWPVSSASTCTLRTNGEVVE
jgi:hypothetical protein